MADSKFKSVAHDHKEFLARASKRTGFTEAYNKLEPEYQAAAQGMRDVNVMNYKGYCARIEYSDEDGCFIGRLTGISDVIGFHGESVAELKVAFEEAVEDYLATCKK